MSREIEVIARAVIIDRQKVLLCQAKNHGNYFLPGGHIEPGESAIETLVRECQEEFRSKIKVNKFIGAFENAYRRDQQNIQEICLLFSGQLEQKNIKSREDHLVFSWIRISDLKKINILPKPLIKEIIAYSKNKRVLWFSKISG